MTILRARIQPRRWRPHRPGGNFGSGASPEPDPAGSGRVNADAMDTGTASFGPEDLLRNAAWMRRLARDESTADDLLQETWSSNAGWWVSSSVSMSPTTRPSS